ncbi:MULTISPECIES: FxsA family protein [Campylobacter]|uniref:FxsA family protein n=1 Tax=Campylobacter TaxID=194 RepID=UPI00138DE5CD|nr:MULTISPECIES: FxsA family protein [Campylobacter]MDV2490032.1 FxsA family protein [Campylobacter sp. TJR-1]
MIKISLFPYFVIEIVCVFIYIINYGFLNFLGEVFLSGIIGIILIFSYGFLNLYSNIVSINLKDIFGSMGIAFGGMLLIVPGILSDIFAVFIIVISLILKIFVRFSTNIYNDNDRFRDDIIDVEIIDENKR